MCVSHEELSYHPEKIEVAIIGAGIIGLALARSFSLQGREVIVFEAERDIGTHSSSRNSEVIHSGIYYTTPLKTSLCIRGKKMLYEYCEANGIRNKKIGKLIVATTDEELPVVERLKERGEANGVHDLVTLSTADVTELEPEVTAVGGIFSPSTGIVDSDGLIRSLKRDACNHGAVVMTSTSVLGGEVRDNGIELRIAGQSAGTILCDVVINSAGLYASKVARSIEGVPNYLIPQTLFAKGHYFTISERPFRHLVYPVPKAGGLGIHVTLDIEGNVRFGPDVTWVDCVNYDFDESRESSFMDAILRYYPELKKGSLHAGYTGIRPKIAGPGEADKDFHIVGPHDHGISGLVHLFGIESPGITCVLSLPEDVAQMISPTT